MRDQGTIPTLTLNGHSFKLDDGHKTGDKIKGVAQLAGGIALATIGGVATIAGMATANPLLVGGGGIATNLGWAASRDSVHNLSGGRYGDPLTVSDLPDILWGAMPLSQYYNYGPWGIAPSGLNLPGLQWD